MARRLSDGVELRAASIELGSRIEQHGEAQRVAVAMACQARAAAPARLVPHHERLAQHWPGPCSPAPQEEGGQRGQQRAAQGR